MKYYFSQASLDIGNIEHEYDKGGNVLKFEAPSSTSVLLDLCVDIKLIISIVQWSEKGRETLVVHDGLRVMIQTSFPNSFALEASRMYILFFSFKHFRSFIYILSYFLCEIKPVHNANTKPTSQINADHPQKTKNHSNLKQSGGVSKKETRPGASPMFLSGESLTNQLS